MTEVELPASTAGGAAAPDVRRARRAWFLYTWGSHAFPTTVLAVFLGPYLTDVAERAAGGSGRYLHLLGVPIRAESFYPYATVVAVLAELVVLPLAGAVADRSGVRRPLLAVCVAVGALATTAMFGVTGADYLLGGVLYVLANVAFGAADAVYNGYLPVLAGADERDRLSSHGWAVGYLGGGLLLAGNVVLYAVAGSSGAAQSFAARVSLGSAGVWWLVFGLLAVRRLRAADVLPAARRAPRAVVERWSASAGYRQFGTTMRELAGNRQALLLVIAFICYNEGIQTVISFASTYGRKQLRLPLSTLTPAILLVQFVAIGGALLMGALAARHGARRTVAGSLGVWVLLLVAAYYVSAGKAWQFYLLGSAIGLVLGGSQALSRSLFAQVVPVGREAEYFGLYEISQNGTAWVGSLMLGLVLQWTGSYRAAIISLVVFFVVGAVMLMRTDVRRAIAVAGNEVPALV